MIDATNPDLSAFSARGGKVLLVQGQDDASVSPLSNMALYQSIVARAGQATAETFIRFYQIPGFAHGMGKFLLSWDDLATLDNWVERGVGPGNLVAVDANAATNGRSRPMCVFPSWPKYKGTGSVDSHLNYTCVTE